ncbi:MAG: Flp family type IVb pilin [Firmicutes bacterium]|jgi:pilus assembly protein Flp/PilA|nr:Flp family type IVb pilin [Bacillota bacterium]
MKNMLARFLADESGQGMTEYALILALIAIVVIGALGLLGGKIKEVFENITDELDVTGEGGS